MKKLLALVLVITLVSGLFIPVYSEDPSISLSNPSVNSATSDLTATVTGTINSGTGKNVTIIVKDKNGIVTYIDQKTSATNGSFTFAFKISSPVEGEYSVKVGGEGVATPAEKTFTYTKPQATSDPGSPGPIVLPPAASASPSPTVEATPTLAVSSTPTPTQTQKPAFTSTPTLKPTPTPTPLPEEVIKAVEQIKDVQTELVKETNIQVAKEKALDLIESAVQTLKSIDKKGVSTKAVESEVIKTAQIVLDKINKEEVSAVAKGQEVKAVISNTQAQKMESRIDEIIKTANALNNAIKDAKTGAKVEAVLEIKIAASKDDAKELKKVDTTLPSSILKKAEEKKIDKVSVDTGFAKISLPPSIISSKTNEIVSISAAKVDTAAINQNAKAAVGDNPVFDFDLKVGDKKLGSFSKPVEVAVPYTIKNGVNHEKVTTFYINDKGQLENIIGFYDSNSGAVKFETKHFSQYVVKENDVKFTDTAASKYEYPIEVLASKGIILGYEGKFNPESNLTRAEFVSLVVRTFKLEDPNASSNFKDVSKKDWYYSTVSSAVKAGLISGRPDKTFAPKEKVSRQDMAVIAANALSKLKGKTLPTDYAEFIKKYKDGKSIADYSQKYISLLARYSIIDSGTDGNYYPARASTRAEAADIIYMIFNLK